MNFEKWITRAAPYLFGWYAIASVMDAMFYTMTGLSFFTGDPYLRVALTVADAVGAVVLHKLLVDSNAARDSRSRATYDEAARAVQSFIAATCTPIAERDTFKFDRSLVEPYMNQIQTASGVQFADIYTRAVQSQLDRQRGLVINVDTTTQQASYSEAL